MLKIGAIPIPNRPIHHGAHGAPNDTLFPAVFHPADRGNQLVASVEDVLWRPANAFDCNVIHILQFVFAKFLELCATSP